MEFTIREFATREKVDESTVRRWIRKGAIVTRHTPGGGVRIIVDDAPASLEPDLLVLRAPRGVSN